MATRTHALRQADEKLMQLSLQKRCSVLQCALLANSAGVGGGPFYVPLLNVVVGFSLQECTGLSHTIVATSAIASTLYGLTHPRPGHPDRPLVDLDVALIFIPALLFGVSIGMSFDSASPPGLCSSLMHIEFEWWFMS